MKKKNICSKQSNCCSPYSCVMKEGQCIASPSLNSINPCPLNHGWNLTQVNSEGCQRAWKILAGGTYRSVEGCDLHLTCYTHLRLLPHTSSVTLIYIYFNLLSLISLILSPSSTFSHKLVPKSIFRPPPRPSGGFSSVSSRPPISSQL